VNEELVDRIYEAGAVPELWPAVLEDFGRLPGAMGAVLVAVRGRDIRWISSDLPFDEFVRDHYASEGGQERTRRLLAARHAGFVTDFDVFTVEEIERDPLFRDFMIPRGGGSGVATAVFAPSGDTFVLHAECPYAAGPIAGDIVAQLDALRPHFARAALLSARLELKRVEAAARALEIVGLPAAVLGRNGRAMAGNSLFDGLVPGLFQDRHARLALVDAGADLLLSQAIAELASAGDRTVRSIPVVARDEQPPTIVHVLPVRGAANDIFSNASALVVVTPVVPREVPTAKVIQGLFDLTPAEARIARAIGNGDSAADIATATGRAAQTVRGQLKAILAKTGLHRQSELVGLLRGVPIPEGGPS
jgi:DNA-binding CsgD family transcriptional regulator